MKQAEEINVIEKWIDMVRSREDVVGKTKAAKTGEEFTTCGDIELDYRVASILLNTVEDRLPNYSLVTMEGEVATGRNIFPIKPRRLQLLPTFLFSIDWAATAPGVSWPESYFVTYVPEVNLRIVTASKDDAWIWGYPDLAIGFCPAVRTPDFGVKTIIQSWWERASGDPEVREPWESFWGAGLIDESRAVKWRDKVFVKARNK